MVDPQGIVRRSSQHTFCCPIVSNSTGALVACDVTRNALLRLFKAICSLKVEILEPF